jgi:hypothetical protein
MSIVSRELSMNGEYLCLVSGELSTYGEYLSLVSPELSMNGEYLCLVSGVRVINVWRVSLSCQWCQSYQCMESISVLSVVSYQ